MSTKIFNGYKLSDQELSLSNATALLDAARAKMDEVATSTLARAKVICAIRMLDRRILRLAGYDILENSDMDTPAQYSCLSYSSILINDDISDDRAKNRRNHLDPSSNICLFSDESGTYALLFSETKEGTKAFQDALGCQEYNYWNSSDPPDDMDEKEWGSRSGRWDKLMGPSSVPSARGATFELVSPSLIWMAPGITAEDFGLNDEGQLPLELMRSISDRTHDLALTQPEAELPASLRPPEGENFKFSVYMEHDQRLRSGAVPEFSAVKDRIAAMLPAAYCFGALRDNEEKTAARFAHLFSSNSRRPSP